MVGRRMRRGRQTNGPPERAFVSRSMRTQAPVIMLCFLPLFGLVADRTLIHPLLGRDCGYFIRQRLQMNRPIVQPNRAVLIKPGECMLEPVLIVSLRKILPRRSAATLCAANRRVQ